MEEATFDGKLIRQGAEARIYESTIFSDKIPCIVKERYKKMYRLKELDDVLTLKRMRAEVRQLLHCRELGIPVPAVFHIDSERRQIWMEHAGEDSVTLNCWFHKVITSDMLSVDQKNKKLDQMTESLGLLLAKVHANHVIHGDLTTANIIVKKGIADEHPELLLIDFGLAGGVACGASQRLVEDKAVDLYVFERALTSSIDRLPTVGEGETVYSPEDIVQKCFKYYGINYPIEAVKCKLPTPGEKRTYVNDSSDPKVTLTNRTKAMEGILHHLDVVRSRGRKRLCVG